MPIQLLTDVLGNQGPLMYDRDDGLDDLWFLAWKCCCDAYQCGTDNLTFYGFYINVNFSGLGGCLSVFEGDNTLTVVGAPVFVPGGWYTDGCIWELNEVIIGPPREEYVIDFGLYTDGIGNFRWYVYVRARPALGGESVKVWYKSHTSGLKDYNGVYTELGCSATVSCLPNTCPDSVGATVTISEP